MRLRFLPLPSTDDQANYVLVLDRVGPDRPWIATDVTQAVAALRGCAGALVFNEAVEVEA